MTKLVVFSDVHGNLPALESMLAAERGADGYICLGDTVDYGPWADECVDAIAALTDAVVLQGNHEEYFLSGIYPGQNEIARTFFEFCYPRFTQRDAIAQLPSEYSLDGWLFRHTIDERNIYPDSEVELDQNIVIGHSHHQFTLRQGPYTLHNVGSVGQNRGRIDLIQYMTLQTESMEFTPRSIAYDVGPVLSEMRRLGYPERCVDYYESKRS